MNPNYFARPIGRSCMIGILALLLSDGMQLSAQQDDVKKFEKDGLQFQLAPKWKVTSQRTYTGTRLIIVNGPNNSIATIQLTEQDVADSIQEYAKSYSDEAFKAIENIQMVKRTFGKRHRNEQGFQVIKEDFTIAWKSKGADAKSVLPHHRIYYQKLFGKYSGFIVCQASEANWKVAEKGFDRIIKSIQYKK